MLHDDGDAVRIGVEGDMQLVVRKLGDGFVRPTFVRPERSDCPVDHSLASLILFGRHFSPSPIRRPPQILPLSREGRGCSCLANCRA